LDHQAEIQKSKLAKGNPYLHLAGSCRLSNGIAALTDDEKKQFIRLFENQNKSIQITYFIPSSGSGSRMFDAVFNFLNTNSPSDETIEFVEHLINSAQDFAFYNKLPQNIKDDLESGNLDIQAFLKLLLFENGFNFGNLPKGLIPFHRYGNFIVNPFQEHILQGVAISGDKSKFHFTINQIFEKQIHESVRILKEITGIDFKHEFSVQNPVTDAIAFDENLNPVLESDGKPITRPAGHGALLANLNSIDSDLIFIRNIDNIQHQKSASHSITTRKALAGVLLKIKESIFKILSGIDSGSNQSEKISQLNSEFQLHFPTEKISDQNFIRDFFNRPIRVCGMVKNEGQPGGGPFWVTDSSGQLRRQIVEKSQIANDPQQLGMIIKSTHFNPVEIVCSIKNFQGKNFNLENFKNEDLYFIVHKTHQGKPIQYVEEPGLWNGGMEKWITLFYEIESDCFSPVKTVIDLLKPMHREI
jgi:hypothetical protein